MEFEVYAVMYTPCMYESAYVPLSYHRTKAGAYRAMRKSKLEAWARVDDLYRNSDATRVQVTKKERGASISLDYERWYITKPQILRIEE